MLRIPHTLPRATYFCGAAGFMVLGCVLAAAPGLAPSSNAQGGTTLLSASVEREIERVVAEIDQVEAQTLCPPWASAPPTPPPPGAGLARTIQR
jgi:hypothetical protein